MSEHETEDVPKVGLFSEEYPNYTPIFPAGLLNHGYWKNIDTSKSMSVDDKVASSRELYRQVLKQLDITKQDRVLEIGCGRGHGAALAMTEFEPSEVHGVDLRNYQVNSALEDNADLVARSSGRLVYKQGSGAALPYSNDYFDKIYSLEALFGEPEPWLSEICRVARNGARFALSSVFASSANVTLKQVMKVLAHRDQLDEVYELDNSIPAPLTIDSIVEKVKDSGFTNVISVSIGEHVFHGFHKWVEQAGIAGYELDGGIYRRWIGAYEQGLCDYYLVTGELVKT